MKLIVANWKMHPESMKDAVELARASDVAGLVIAPPFPFIEVVAEVINKGTLGAQDLFWEGSGPYTGEVSPSQLASLGVKYVIVGHSERRAIGETDEMVGRKVAAAMKFGLTPILCVGESGIERKNGQTNVVVGRQLTKGMSHVISERLRGTMVVAYEPIWAIGTGKPDSPESMASVAELIRATIRRIGYRGTISVLYGGSVSAKNAGSFLDRVEIDGALVGGASLSAEEITKIVHRAKT